MPDAGDCLDPITDQEKKDAKCVKLPTSVTGQNCVLNGMTRIVDDGGDPVKHPHFIDCESSQDFAAVPRAYMGCITATRGKTRGWWVTSRGRCLTIGEVLRFQGLDLRELNRRDIPDSEVGKMAGNAMSANVLERVMTRALYHASLTPKPLVDQWEDPSYAMANRFT